MSCLTKKSLFLMVLTIVCNTTFSGDNPGPSRYQRRSEKFAGNVYLNLECKAHVIQVFKDQDPFNSFQLAMFALSSKVINDITSTEDLSNTIIDQYNKFKEAYGPDEYKNISGMGTEIGKQKITFSELGKTYIFGYMKFLVHNFNQIYQSFKEKAYPPEQFCQTHYKSKNSAMECKNALSILFNRHDVAINNMKAMKAFNLCYLYHNYLEFTDDRMFSEPDPNIRPNTQIHKQYKISSSSTDFTPDQQLHQQYQLSIMETYFKYLMEKISEVVKKKLKEENHKLIPTVDDYCKGPGRNVA